MSLSTQNAKVNEPILAERSNRQPGNTQQRRLEQPDGEDTNVTSSTQGLTDIQQESTGEAEEIGESSRLNYLSMDELWASFSHRRHFHSRDKRNLC